MRLASLDRGHRIKEKLLLAMIRVLSRNPPQDVVKTLLYRPEFFGRPFSDVVHRVLRGPSEWSVGERELFAAYTSKLNQCVF
ncbi:MAG: hypothetical protein ACE5PT_05145 [Gemmatimonadales bacterium]